MSEDTYPVTYHCPRCGALAEIQRSGYLADRSVTPYPLTGWDYAGPDGAVEAADGVAFTCGEDGTLVEGESGCGEPFYLSYVRFEDGERVEPEPPAERVRLSTERGPRGPPEPGP